MADEFFFAWVANTETTFDDVAHARWDEDVFSCKIEHMEGDYPTLTLIVRNPRVGLLSAGRPVWAWLSRSVNGVVTPLFFGRLIGIPSNVFQELVELHFLGRPIDFNAQKQALVAPLKVHPHYNPTWIKPEERSNPDVVLEGYSAFFHIDRQTLAVTISDILVGEDGVETFTADEILDGTMSLTIGQAPLGEIRVSGTIGWTQRASGYLDVTPKPFKTLNGDAIFNDWPKQGADLGGGWSVAESSLWDVHSTHLAFVRSTSSQWNTKRREHENGDTMSVSISGSRPVVPADNEMGMAEIMPYTEEIVDLKTQTGILDPYGDPPLNVPASVSGSMRWTFMWHLVPQILKLAYTAARGRKETLEFTLKADFQKVLTDDADDTNFETISLSGEDVDVEIDGNAPIGSLQRRSFFATDKGRESIEYLICLARAKLLMRSRVVEIEFETFFERGVNLSCRKNALIYNSRLPGGQAAGKIIGYTLSCDGATGALRTSIKMACTIGYGNAIATSPGSPIYVDAGYVDVGYQFYENEVIALSTSDVGYTVLNDDINDDGVVFPLTKGNAIVNEDREDNDVVSGKNEVSGTYWELSLRDLTTSFESTYTVETTLLVAPAQIDLEAAS